MASQEKIVDIIAGIKTMYSYYGKETDTKTLISLWSLTLSEYDDEIVTAAFLNCLRKCKNPPTPADIVEQIDGMRRALEPSDDELWAAYYSALIETRRQAGQFYYTYIDATGISQGDQARIRVHEIWERLPCKIKMYLATEGELIRKARTMTEDGMTFERNAFTKSMPSMQKRKEYGNMAIGCGFRPAQNKLAPPERIEEMNRATEDFNRKWMGGDLF